MNRMRVVSFDNDKVLSEKNTANETHYPPALLHPGKKEQFKRLHDNKPNNHGVSTGKKKPQRPKTNKSTNTERKVSRKEDNTRLKAVKKMSELFRLRTKGNIIRSYTSIKTISLDDIIKTLTRNVYGDSEKKNYKQGFKNNPAKKNNKQKKRIESQDDIKVLYSFERSKSPNYGNLFSTKNPGKRNNCVRRSSSDIFGIGNAHNNTYLCFRSSRNTGLFPTPKRRKKRTESNPNILHEANPLCIPRHESMNVRFERNSPTDHFNVVCFPKVNAIGKSKVNAENVNDSSYVVRDQKVARSPSLDRAVSMDHKRDAANSPAAVETKPVPSAKSVQVHLRSDKKIIPILIRLFRKTFCTCLVKLASVLNYVLIVLTIIAWSPCLFIMALYWLLVYPLKPHYVTEDDEKTEKRVTSKATCYKKTFRSLAFKMKNFFKSVFREKCKPPKSRKLTPCESIHRNSPKAPSKWQPNPIKRYILFYDSERGWLMKPLRSEECEPCMKQSEVVQNLRVKSLRSENRKRRMKSDGAQNHIMKSLRSEDSEEPLKQSEVVKNHGMKSLRSEERKKQSDAAQNFSFKPSKVVTFSDTLIQNKRQPAEFNHVCECPPTPANITYPNKVSIDEPTYDRKSQMTARETRQSDTISGPVTVAEHDHSKEKDKPTRLSTTRSRVIPPEMALYGSYPNKDPINETDPTADQRIRQSVTIPEPVTVTEHNNNKEKDKPTRLSTTRSRVIPPEMPLYGSYLNKGPIDETVSTADQRIRQSVTIPEPVTVTEHIHSKGKHKPSHLSTTRSRVIPPEMGLYGSYPNKASIDKTTPTAHRRFRQSVTIPEPVTLTEHDYRKGKEKATSLFRTRDRVIPPKMALYRTCPKHTKPDCKWQRVTCQKCREELKCQRCCGINKRPHRIQQILPPRAAFRSKAPMRYTKSTKDTKPTKDTKSKNKEILPGKKFARNMKSAVNDAEKQWDWNFQCTRKRPCSWIYYRCPSIYPAFLICHTICSKFCYVMMVVLSVCFWCPLFVVCYLCAKLYCLCFC